MTVSGKVRSKFIVDVWEREPEARTLGSGRYDQTEVMGEREGRGEAGAAARRPKCTHSDNQNGWIREK